MVKLISTSTIALSIFGFIAPATAITFSSDPESNLDAVGVNPGDQFRIAFVTEGSRDATSFDIDDYNTFVDGDADNTTFNNAMDILLGSVIQDDFSGNAAAIDYSAIASTNSTNGTSAQDNTNTPNTDGEGEPILLVDGSAIADDYSDLWDGDIGGDIGNAIDMTTLSDELNVGFVWTGTSSDGTSDQDFLGSIDPVIGDVTATNSNWINVSANITGDRQTERPFYGLSEPLTRASEPEAVPFHTDTLPGGIAVGGFIFWRYLRHKRQANNSQ